MVLLEDPAMITVVGSRAILRSAAFLDQRRIPSQFGFVTLRHIPERDLPNLKRHIWQEGSRGHLSSLLPVLAGC